MIQNTISEYKNLLIVFSHDEHGWYAQDPNNNWNISAKLYFTLNALKYAIDNNLIKWVEITFQKRNKRGRLNG